jgi:capsular polysaccharide biosynthesis protein
MERKDILMENTDLSKYLSIVRKWWWIIVLLPAASLATMLVIFFISEPQYRATVTVQVSAPPPQEVPLYSSLGKQALSDEIIRTQTSLNELLVEGDVAYRVLAELPDIPMTGGELRQRIEVNIPEDSHLMRIAVKTENAEMSALLANAVVETALQQYAELAAKPTAGMRQFIEVQLDLAQSEYEAAETELTEFQVANKIGSLDTALDRQYDLIRTLKATRDIAESDNDAARVRTLDNIILEREAELQNLIGLSSEYYTLVGRVNRARDTYNFMLDKKAEAQIKENQILELASVQIITPARPPVRPVAAMDSRIIVLGTVSSLIVGVLLAVLLEYLQVSGLLASLKSLGENTSRSETREEPGKAASLG